jgi:O-antigen/teichoic acid export membrane protein
LAWRFLQTTALATAALSTAVGFAFQVLLPWVAEPALVAQWSAFWLIVAGLAARYMADFGALALFTAHLDRLTTVTNLASVGILVIAQLALLPLAGLHGAGAAILLTSLIMVLWRYWLLFGFPMSNAYSRRVGA